MSNSDPSDLVGPGRRTPVSMQKIPSENALVYVYTYNSAGVGRFADKAEPQLTNPYKALEPGGKYGASMRDFYGTAAKEGRQSAIKESLVSSLSGSARVLIKQALSFNSHGYSTSWPPRPCLDHLDSNQPPRLKPTNFALLYVSHITVR